MIRTDRRGRTVDVMNRTLAHDLLLLSLDEQGRRTRKDLVGHGVVGAVLAELALAGRLEIVRKRVTVVNPVPVGNERLDTVLARIAADKPRKPQQWVEKLRKGHADQLIEDLTAAGVLRREEERVLGFIHSDRYLQPDSRPTDELRSRLRSLLAGGPVPEDPRLVVLAHLVQVTGVHKLVAPELTGRQVKRRIGELSLHPWAYRAVRKAIEATQASAAVILAVAVASTSD